VRAVPLRLHGPSWCAGSATIVPAAGLGSFSCGSGRRYRGQYLQDAESVDGATSTRLFLFGITCCVLLLLLLLLLSCCCCCYMLLGPGTMGTDCNQPATLKSSPVYWYCIAFTHSHQYLLAFCAYHQMSFLGHSLLC